MGFSSAAAGAAAAGAAGTAAAAAPTILGLSLPTIGLISGGLGALSSLGGAIMSSQAQSRNANAIAQQNTATTLAQNEAFQQRIGAASRQTDAQTAVMQQSIADRNAAAQQMRQAQSGALGQQQDVLAAENAQEAQLRQAGDTNAQQLLAATTAAQQAQQQQQYQTQAATLLGQAAPQGPGPTDPSGGDAMTKQAIATRLAQAATNVRNYGAKVAAVGSYQEPLAGITDAITASKSGIMPAQTAEALLKSGNTVRLLPSQVAFQQAGSLGQATDQLLQSRAQSGLDAAGLSYGNATNLANLGQSDTDTIAANRSAQAKADATYQQQVAGIYSGIGNLGLYGAGRIIGLPDFLNPTPTKTT